MKSQNPLVSVVTPAYNAERFARQAYDCLRRQSYETWEWVVVDDGSTDDTPTLLRQLAAADTRVRLYRQAASGSAKQPRDHAVSEAHGDFILAFDIDDRLGDDYLECMVARQQETDADIVYARMHFIDLDTGKTTQTLPAADFDTGRVYTGRELVRETMPEWRIGCNGGLYRRHVWVNTSWPERHEPVWMNSDEVDERLYLLQAGRVAFAQADYYYQNHTSSITASVSPKLFHTLKTGQQLTDIADREFGPDSEEHRRATLRAFYDWRCKMRLYVERHRKLTDADAMIHHNLCEAMQHIDASALSAGERRRFLGLRSFPLLLALFCLRYSPGFLAEKMMQCLAPTAYRRFVVRRRTEQATARLVAPHYARPQASPTPAVPCAVSLYCQEGIGGGLADRLRGAVSLYQACMATGTAFKLHFTHPFPLTDYLVPCTYDWTIGPDQLTFDPQKTTVVIADTQPDTPAMRRWQRRHLIKALRQGRGRQLHVYTNAPFCYDNDFAASWAQLFRPTPRLEQSILREQQRIGANNYTVVSARFCNLLDDFNEETYNEPLGGDAREHLVEACLAQLRQLHDQAPTMPLVLCSDSTRFIGRATATLPFVHTTEGTVTHIGNDADAHGYAYYERTFVDFFTIARAQRVVRLLGPGMMASGFPLTAALTQGRQCEDIHFETDI